MILAPYMISIDLETEVRSSSLKERKYFKCTFHGNLRMWNLIFVRRWHFSLNSVLQKVLINWLKSSLSLSHENLHQSISVPNFCRQSFTGCWNGVQKIVRFHIVEVLGS